MNHISESLLALDDFIANVSRVEKEKIWLQVKAMNIQGPSVGQYFTDLLYNSHVNFRFDDDIRLSGHFKPPQNVLKVNIETPKFSLESFF